MDAKASSDYNASPVSKLEMVSDKKGVSNKKLNENVIVQIFKVCIKKK